MHKSVGIFDILHSSGSLQKKSTYSLSPLCVLLGNIQGCFKIRQEETSTICQYFANRIFYSFHNTSQGYPSCQIY